jgi:hypothetical protein
MSYKVVYNSRYGGFGMSKEGLAEYNRVSSQTVKGYYCIDRDDPILIHLVETMGAEINDDCSRLKIKEFPMKYKLFLKWTEYDGLETVCIDYERYLISNVRDINDDTTISSDEKIKLIQEQYNEYDERTLIT